MGKSDRVKQRTKYYKKRRGFCKKIVNKEIVNNEDVNKTKYWIGWCSVNSSVQTAPTSNNATISKTEMDMPKPMTANSYDKIVQKLLVATKPVAFWWNIYICIFNSIYIFDFV